MNYKNISLVSAIFIIFSLIQVLISSVIYFYKIGFSYLNVSQYFIVNNNLISAVTILKVLSPHFLSQILVVFILSHLLQFSKVYKKKVINRVVVCLFFFTFFNIIAVFVVRFFLFGFFYIKTIAFLGFMFFYFLSSIMILKSFFNLSQSRTVTNLKK